MESPSQHLEAEYLQRRRKNPAYSLRAFSRLLDLPSGRVSQLLGRKRRFTPKLGAKIAVQLGYDPERTRQFLDSIAASRGRRPGTPPLPARELAPLPMDQFEAIADPVHFSILSLLETTGFGGTCAHVASNLGIDSVEARAACERLVRLGLVKESKGKLRLGKAPGLATSHDVRNAALRRSHRKVLEESIAALEEIPVELRDVTSITMAIDPARLPEAKERLRELRRSLSDFLETGTRTEVYRLNVQLVPVTRGKKK